MDEAKAQVGRRCREGKKALTFHYTLSSHSNPATYTNSLHNND